MKANIFAIAREVTNWEENRSPKKTRGDEEKIVRGNAKSGPSLSGLTEVSSLPQKS